MPSAMIIDNARVILLDRIEDGWSVVCDGGRIAWVGPSRERRGMRAETALDAQGRHLAPGFIDLHIHGSGDFLVDDGPDSLIELSRRLPRYGVTGFLPAVCPRAKGQDSRFVAQLSKAQPNGAEILGFLLEGPFLTIAGALAIGSVGEADIERVRDLIAATSPYTAIFTIAPDFPGIADLLPTMRGDGAPIFITHTRADAARTQLAIAAGARHATHFYDVFYSPPESEMGVRPAGAVEAILADPCVSVDFILDGEHVDPIVVQMALRCKGPDRVCLITDANRGAGSPPGRYSFGEHEVEFAYPGGPARFTADHPTLPGTLAGSGLTMDQAVRNAVDMLGIYLPPAVRMASANPARVLGLESRKGQIAVGFDADLALLDKDLRPLRTWVAGVCRFVADGSDSPARSKNESED